MLKYVNKYVKDGKAYYRIRKNYNGREYQIFQSPKWEQVRQVWLECNVHEWNKEDVLQIRDKYKKQRPLLRDTHYITVDDKGGYRVQRYRDGRAKYYGKARTLEGAMRLRDQLVRSGWRQPSYQKRKVRNSKFIRRTPNGKYRLMRMDGGVWTCYGTYDSFSDAVEERRFWKSIDWDMDLLDLY